MDSNFTFYTKKFNEKRTWPFLQEGAAEAIINNAPGHKSWDRYAFLPVEIFPGKNSYITDKNKNGKIEQKEMIVWLKEKDEADGKIDGIIQPGNVADDSLDLLGLKSGKSKAIEEDAIVRGARRGLEKLESVADNWFIMLPAKGKIVDFLGQKENMDYVLENKVLRDLFVKIKRKNPDLIKDSMIKAFGKKKGFDMYLDLY